MKKYIAITGLLIFAGCAVGPDFEKPVPPGVAAYTEKPLSLGNGQTLVSGEDISGEWWTLFRSRALDDLIERALQSNPDLKAAQAALKIAHENTEAGYGAYYPGVTAGFSASRNKTSGQLSPNTSSGSLYYSLYTPQVSVSYAPDVFGLNARTIESLQAQEERARFALIATNIVLTSNVVSAAIQEASLRDQIAAMRENIRVGTDILRLLRNQFARGAVSSMDVATQQAQLAQATAALPPLLNQLAQQRDLLAVLTGKFPGEGFAETFALSDIALPRELPLSLPARLVEQRPDVRQAEENLHDASAQIGVAVANRLPNLTLTGDLGSMALAAGQTFAGGTGFWTLAADVTQPVFDGGILLHKERAARAAFEQAADQYHNTVLAAFQNVADALHALQQDADILRASKAGRDAARNALEIAQRQMQSGSVTYLAILNAQQTFQQTQITLIQAEASRYSDTAALFLALGGGWWNQKEALTSDPDSQASAD